MLSSAIIPPLLVHTSKVKFLNLHDRIAEYGRKTQRYGPVIWRMIIIDGSRGEGGGQIIRTALTLSAITGQPFRVEKIRANRPNPGLQPQHLMAVKAVRSICRGQAENADIESESFGFRPNKIIGGDYEFNIGTAGSVVLVAQTILPLLLFAGKPSKVKIIGGTHVMKSPSYDYFENVFLPAVQAMGADVKTRIKRAGFYPAGGGEIEIEVNPSKPKGKDRWKKEGKIKAIITLGNLDESIAIREKKIFLQNNIGEVYIRRYNTASPGNAVLVWQGFAGAYVLGEKGKRAEVVAEEAVDELKKEIAAGAEVDKHLADQLLLYAALAEGQTRYKTSQITEHLKTNAEIIGAFVKDKKIEIKEETKEIVAR